MFNMSAVKNWYFVHLQFIVLPGASPYLLTLGKPASIPLFLFSQDSLASEVCFLFQLR